MTRNSKTPFEMMTDAETPRLLDSAASTRNPLHLWNAIRLLVVAQAIKDGDETVLPDSVSFPIEIVDYLFRVACTLHAMQGNTYQRLVGSVIDPMDPPLHVDDSMAAREIDHKDAVKLASDALGLSRAGWNAFADIAGAADKMSTAWFYKHLRSQGLSSKEAVARLMEVDGAASERKVRRKVRQGASLAQGKRAEPE